MTIREIRAVKGLSRAAFSKRYGIPLRTLENWESDKHHCRAYVIELLERCIVGDAEAQKIDESWDISKIVEVTGYTREKFAQKYHIPVRTIVEWAAGRRHCPPYVLKALNRCVRYDERTRVYIHRSGVSIKGSRGKKYIICDFEEDEDYKIVLEELKRLRQAVLDGEFDERWKINTDKKRKAISASLIISHFQAHELR